MINKTSTQQSYKFISHYDFLDNNFPFASSVYREEAFVLKRSGDSMFITINF